MSDPDLVFRTREKRRKRLLKDSMTQTIMIGVNDPNIAYLLQRYAEESGHASTQVRQSQEIPTLARALKPTFIILDLALVETANWEIVRRLKAEPATSGIPIIIYSYLDEPPDKWHEGVDGYLKSARYDDFVAVLEQAKQAGRWSENPTEHYRVSNANEFTARRNTLAENIAQKPVLLQVNSLKKHFPITRGFFLSKTVGYVKAVDDVSFYIREGETLGLVGESGCGKTTIGRLILRAYEPTSGEIWFNDRKLGRVNVPALDKKQLAQLRQNMQLIFQDPYSSLNPRMTLLEIVGEPLYVNNVARGAELKERVAELLKVVGLRPEYMVRYPHAFSGGQRQRIGVARALALNPQLVVCDEPVSALDVSIQAQILNLLKDLQVQFGLTYLFISHDLSVVEHISDRVAVMYVGKLVESAETSELYTNPKHPYTEALLSAVPKPDPRMRTEPIILPGEVADPANPPSGCYFHPRCQYRVDRCVTDTPVLREIAPEHFVSCHRAEELRLTGVLGPARSVN
jgi:peptide/nickel transport system ATP-binding protein